MSIANATSRKVARSGDARDGFQALHLIDTDEGTLVTRDLHGDQRPFKTRCNELTPRDEGDKDRSKEAKDHVPGLPSALPHNFHTMKCLAEVVLLRLVGFLPPTDRCLNARCLPL